MAECNSGPGREGIRSDPTRIVENLEQEEAKLGCDTTGEGVGSYESRHSNIMLNLNSMYRSLPELINIRGMRERIDILLNRLFYIAFTEARTQYGEDGHEKSKVLADFNMLCQLIRAQMYRLSAPSGEAPKPEEAIPRQAAGITYDLGEIVTNPPPGVQVLRPSVQEGGAPEVPAPPPGARPPKEEALTKQTVSKAKPPEPLATQPPDRPTGERERITFDPIKTKHGARAGETVDAEWTELEKRIIQPIREATAALRPVDHNSFHTSEEYANLLRELQRLADMSLPQFRENRTGVGGFVDVAIGLIRRMGGYELGEMGHFLEDPRFQDVVEILQAINEKYRPPNVSS